MLNLTKAYDELLELDHYNESQRRDSLLRIFNRDIADNSDFYFRDKVIRPLKSEDATGTEVLFHHLTCEEIEVEEGGRKFKRRVYEKERSIRIHWIKHHIEERIDSIHVFSVSERDQKKSKDVIKTYIYNSEKKYIIVLQPQKSEMDYYLLSAYHLNKSWGEKSIKKKMKKRLAKVY